MKHPTQDEIITFNQKEYNRKNEMKKIWTVWKYTIGSFSDERTRDHDNTVAILRTIIVAVNVLTLSLIHI